MRKRLLILSLMLLTTGCSNYVPVVSDVMVSPITAIERLEGQKYRRPANYRPWHFEGEKIVYEDQPTTLPSR